MRLAQKVNEIRDDLGLVSSVLAERVEARMLRQGDDSLDIEHELELRRDQTRVNLEQFKRQFADDIALVRDQYSTSIKEMNLSPET